MRMFVTANQIKAARAHLGWSQEELALTANISLSTLRALEAGNISPRRVVNVVRALEEAGIEFIEGDGLRKRPRDVRIIQASDSCDQFFEDIKQSLQDTGGIIQTAMPSQDMLLQSLGIDTTDQKRLRMLGDLARVQCLVSEGKLASFHHPSFQFRLLPRHAAIPSPYYLYGDRLTLALREGKTDFRFVMFTSKQLVHEWRSNFQMLWEGALPNHAAEPLHGNSAALLRQA